MYQEAARNGIAGSMLSSQTSCADILVWAKTYFTHPHFDRLVGMVSGQPDDNNPWVAMQSYWQNVMWLARQVRFPGKGLARKAYLRIFRWKIIFRLVSVRRKVLAFSASCFVGLLLLGIIVLLVGPDFFVSIFLRAWEIASLDMGVPLLAIIFTSSGVIWVLLWRLICEGWDGVRQFALAATVYAILWWSGLVAYRMVFTIPSQIRKDSMAIRKPRQPSIPTPPEEAYREPPSLLFLKEDRMLDFGSMCDGCCSEVRLIKLSGAQRGDTPVISFESPRRGLQPGQIAVLSDGTIGLTMCNLSGESITYNSVRLSVSTTRKRPLN